MTKYYIPEKIPHNSKILKNKIIINKSVILKEEDIIIVGKDYNLTILAEVKFTIKKIVNYGKLENAGDICVNTLNNYGFINNVDLLIVNGGDLNNEGIIENYCFLYLLRARKIYNKKDIKNFYYTGGIVLMDEKKLTGKKIKNYF